MVAFPETRNPRGGQVVTRSSILDSMHLRCLLGVSGRLLDTDS